MDANKSEKNYETLPFLLMLLSLKAAAGTKDTIIFEVDSFRGDAEITTAPFVSRKGMFDMEGR